MMSKRLKGVAYTQGEQATLMDLIEERKDALECKVTDKGSLKLKNDAWEDVTLGYNAMGPTCLTLHSK